MTQFALQTAWHETVYAMRMAGARTRDIIVATGYTTGGIGKVIAKFRARGVVFPPIDGSSPMAGIKAKDWPNSIHMQHVTGTLPSGVRIRCHSQSRADAVAELEGLGGVVDG